MLSVGHYACRTSGCKVGPEGIGEKLDFKIKVKPLISNHPKCEDLVVAYGRQSLKRIKPQGPFLEEV